jgi:hypothetical protein
MARSEFPLRWHPQVTAGQNAFFGGSGTLIGTSSIFTNTTNLFVGIGTTTPAWPLNVFGPTNQLGLSNGIGINQRLFANEGGNLYIGTSTVAGTASSTQFAALSINSTGAPSLAIGSTSPQVSVVNGMLILGTNTPSGSTTIETGKVQFDAENSAGAPVCAFVNSASAWTVIAGKCTP